MSKANTIDALIASAIHCFSRHGYEGASLRDIAAHAGVPLSTIHTYFGSKSDLYEAIARKSWDEIDHERSELLAAALARAQGRPLTLAELFHALAMPVVRRALGASELDRDRIFIVRGRLGTLAFAGNANMLDIVDRSMVRWIDAMAEACPTLMRQDIIWAFSFVVGAIYSWQLVDHRYDRLLGEDLTRTVEGVTRDIVAFGCAGVQGLVEHRAAESARCGGSADGQSSERNAPSRVHWGLDAAS